MIAARPTPFHVLDSVPEEEHTNLTEHEKELEESYKEFSNGSPIKFPSPFTLGSDPGDSESH
jgi:hypothetical protein